MADRSCALENLVMTTNGIINKKFWHGKKVLITGHTGFKGSWLSLWLQLLDAEVTGLSLAPDLTPNLFSIASVESGMNSIMGDIRDMDLLTDIINQHSPDIIFHLAAQSLVRRSYEDPLETYTTNVLGTANLFEAVRRAHHPKAIVNVTSDKCYENKESNHPYTEQDVLGGYDPYSNSKACSELITASYRNSFFREQQIGLASARAGNVIGGGDWAKDRLIPDIMRAFLENKPLELRYPNAVRPWQYVLDPLFGYLLLAEKLYEQPILFAEAWNFSLGDNSIKTVADIVNDVSILWGCPVKHISVHQQKQPHETHQLHLDATKAKQKLKWKSNYSLEQGLKETVAWFQAYQSQRAMRDFTLHQITSYMNS